MNTAMTMKGIKPVRRTMVGFTVLELMLALAVAAILFGWGLPSIQESIRTNQVLGQSNEFVSIVNFAKNEAIRRNTTVPVVLTATAAGWDAAVEDPAEEVNVEGCDVGELRCSSNSLVTMVADVAQIDFNNRGYIRDADEPWTGETLFLQHNECSGNNQRRRIDITPTGQVSSCALPCDSEAACP